MEAERPLLGPVEDRSRLPRFGRLSGVALLTSYRQRVYPTLQRDLFNIDANAPQAARDKFVRSVLKLEYDTTGGIKFRSVTGFQTGNTLYRADLDGTASIVPPNDRHDRRTTPSTTTSTETQFSQEFNIISPDNQRFTWLVGAFGLWNSYFFPQPFSNFMINLCYPRRRTAQPRASTSCRAAIPSARSRCSARSASRSRRT